VVDSLTAVSPDSLETLKYELRRVNRELDRWKEGYGAMRDQKNRYRAALKEYGDVASQMATEIKKVYNQ
jgi:hypothetical protein